MSCARNLRSDSFLAGMAAAALVTAAFDSEEATNGVSSMRRRCQQPRGHRESWDTRTDLFACRREWPDLLRHDRPSRRRPVRRCLDTVWQPANYCNKKPRRASAVVGS
ncbi:hypothetical protein BS78_07G046600 [Paspalum vaginatum]|nr:hypothetical protein BS78_07G046600 [Paspalum vaginatum]